MTGKANSLLQQALELEESDRLEIAGALLGSVEPLSSHEVEAAWREEISKRLAEWNAGGVETVEWSEVRERLAASPAGG